MYKYFKLQYARSKTDNLHHQVFTGCRIRLSLYIIILLCRGYKHINIEAIAQKAPA